MDLHAFRFYSKCIDNLLLEFVICNVKSISMLPVSELFDLTACKSLYIGRDVFSVDLDCRYVLVFKRFGNVHLIPTSDKNLDIAFYWHGHYARDKAENVSSLSLWTLI